MRSLLSEPWLWPPLALACVVNLGLVLLLGGIFARRYFGSARLRPSGAKHSSEYLSVHSLERSLGHSLGRSFGQPLAPWPVLWPALGLALLLGGTLGETAYNLWLFGFLSLPELGRYLLQEPAGRSLLLAFIGALVLLAGETGRWKWPLLLPPALLVLYGVGAQSHAVMHGAPAIGMEMAHLAAMSAWIGGVGWLTLANHSNGAPTPTELDRMTPVALLALTTLALSGWYAAALNGGELTALARSDYGWVLAQKLLALLLALAAAGWLRLRLARRLGPQPALRLELALLLAVLLLSSWLGGTEPSAHLH